jgi:hypothetical protein
MGNKYRLEVITDQLKSDGFLPRVRVIMDYSDDFHEQHYINTFADLSEDKQVIPQMTEWCAENECGYRTSYDTFKFRNQEQLTMFILRWS